MTSGSRQRGQAMILTVVFLTVLLALCAAVIDVGSWYRAHRQAQATADAAALAGAQALPESTGNASSLALDYAGRNGGGVGSADVVFSSTVTASDTIGVTARRPVAGVFSRLFGIDSVTGRASAQALAEVMGEAKWVAPIGVDILHPLLQCEPLPCFDQPTTLDLRRTGPGAFRLINIDGSRGGTSPATLADWIRHGLDAYMPLDWYYSDPGAKFNSSHVQSALQERIGSELLFPVYRRTRGGGANFEYEVVGWVGFHLTRFTARGSSGELYGWFTRIIWEGIGSERQTGDDFGTRTISLIH